MRAYWAGQFPPLQVSVKSEVLLGHQSFCREIPEYHGAFDAVFFVEQNLDELDNWRVVLDELLRLLRRGSRTRLTVRVSATRMRLAEFANFLARKIDFLIVPSQSSAALDMPNVLTFDCIRSGLEPSLQTLGFGVISDGLRPQHLLRFVDSISNVRGIERREWQVALCGPSSLRELPLFQRPDASMHNVIVVDEPSDWQEAGWITRKKNLLVEALDVENLTIVHDRYTVPPDFLERLEQFGSDFDVIVPRQVQNGRRFPDWTATETKWGHTGTYLLPYNAWNEFAYVNGGAIIAKRDVLAKNPWNELLFWDQCEDVELSRRMADRGVTVRVAPSVWLNTDESRDGYVRAFERTRHDGTPMPPHIGFLAGARLDLRGLTLEHIEQKGLIAWPCQWRPSASGLQAIARDSELTLCHVDGDASHICLTLLAPPSAPCCEFTVNDVCVAPAISGMLFTLDLRDVPAAAGGQLIVRFQGKYLPTLAAIELVSAARPVSYPVSMTDSNPAARHLLGQGWWNLEHWGVWSRGTQSFLVLPTSCGVQGGQVVIDVALKALPVPGHSSKILGISCNDLPIRHLSIRCDGRVRRYKIRVPAVIASKRMTIKVGLTVGEAFSPSADGISRDARDIGIGLVSIDVGGSNTRRLVRALHLLRRRRR